MVMIFFELSKHLLMSISIGVNCTLAKRILERKHLHSIFNLGYCLYFILSAVVAPLQLAERFNLLSIVAETGQTGALVGSFARKGNKANPDLAWALPLDYVRKDKSEHDDFII